MDGLKRIEKWRTDLLTFTSSKSYNNPFLDVQIMGLFVAPSGRTIKREAYWNGGNEYKISFAPTELGEWSYSISAPEETGLNGIEGKIECIPYEGELDIYKHGFLKVAADKNYLCYDDGTPFFWLGDTHWEFSYRENWDESNHPKMTSMFKGMADLRAKQGYNIYQTNLRSDKMMGGESYYWKEVDGGLLPNVDFYKNELDRRMQYLADLGFVNALGQAWFMGIEEGVDKQKQLIRYIMARYGSLPMVWTLAGEVAGYDSIENKQMRIDGWREVALYIEQLDSYGQLQTAHYTNERPFAEYYQDESWFDFTLNQAGHGDYIITVNDYQEFLKKHSDKPFIEGEAMYEFCSTLEEMGTRLCTDDMLRRVAYTSIQLGGCGYTYGASGIWDYVWKKGLENPMKLFNRFDITWYEAIDGIGGEQMGYMRKFYENVRFWELKPLQMDEEDGNLFGSKFPLVTVNVDRNHFVFYYADGARKKITINNVENGVYKLNWFNPKTGDYIDGGIVEVKDHSMVSLSKPDDGDWLLEVVK